MPFARSDLARSRSPEGEVSLTSPVSFAFSHPVSSQPLWLLNRSLLPFLLRIFLFQSSNFCFSFFLSLLCLPKPTWRFLFPLTFFSKTKPSAGHLSDGKKEDSRLKAEGHRATELSQGRVAVPGHVLPPHELQRTMTRGQRWASHPLARLKLLRRDFVRSEQVDGMASNGW